MEALLAEVARVLCDQVPGEHLRIYLFGSWTQGKALRVSDLDIGLDTGNPIEFAILQKIDETLDELPTLRKIDIIDLQAITPEFRDQVTQQGELLYAR